MDLCILKPSDCFAKTTTRSIRPRLMMSLPTTNTFRDKDWPSFWLCYLVFGLVCLAVALCLLRLKRKHVRSVPLAAPGQKDPPGPPVSHFVPIQLDPEVQPCPPGVAPVAFVPFAPAVSISHGGISSISNTVTLCNYFSTNNGLSTTYSIDGSNNDVHSEQTKLTFWNAFERMQWQFNVTF